jgi:putative membrane protein
MMWDYGDDRWRMHDQSGVGWLMVVLMLVVAIAVVVAVVALLRGWTPATPATPHPGPGTRAADPRAILQDRFARGEIDEQDYRTRIRALDETGPTGG